MAESNISNPGVHFPPPLLFVGAFLAGWAAHRRWPLPIAGERWDGPREAVGALVVVAGLSLVAWALVTFRRHRTAIYPNQPASRIVRDGPYGRTRNPMYLSMTLLYLGMSFLVNSALPVALLPVALVLLTKLVIAREERYLRSAFAEEYGAYCRDVRRWL